MHVPLVVVVDPAKDVEVTVTDGMLTLHAERSEQNQERHHSEFRYGSFDRSVRPPEGARPEKVTATYNDGILTVRVAMEQDGDGRQSQDQGDRRSEQDLTLHRGIPWLLQWQQRPGRPAP